MFIPENMMTFTLFSSSHFGALVVFFVLFFILFLNKERLRRGGRFEKITGYMLLVVLLVSEVSYQVWSISYGVWDARSYIPLHLCSFSTFLGIFLFWKRSEWIFYFYLYIGFFPPILALVTPDLLFEFPHYRYFKFFLHHMAIPLMVVYLFYSHRYTLQLRSILYGMIVLNMMAVPIFFINQWLGSNYFFLSGPPEADTALSLFGEGFRYYLNLELAAIAIFTMTYFFFRYADIITNRRREKARPDIDS